MLETKEETGRNEILETPGSEFPAVSSQPVAAVSLEVLRDEAALLSVRNAWEDLVEHSSASVYQTFDWLFLWWKHFGGGKRRNLHVLMVHRGLELICIAPLYLETKMFLGRLIHSRLSLMGSDVMDREYAARAADGGPSDYLDVIVRNGCEAVASDVLVKYFRDRLTLVDEIEFKNVPQESLLLSSVVPSLERLGFICQSFESDVCPRLKTPETMKKYLDSLDSEVRHRLKRALKSFHENKSHSVEDVLLTGTFRAAFADLIRLHQERWNHLGYLGLFADVRFRAFQEEVTQALMNQRRLWFKAVSIDGARVGTRLGFVFKDRMYDYLSGFDDRPAFAQSRPGLALLAMMIEDSVQSRMQTVDFLRGAEQYKFDLTSEISRNCQISIHPPAGNGGLWIVAKRVVLALPGVWRRVRKEGLIIRVHAKTHGMLRFLPQYLGFLLQRAFSGRRLEALGPIRTLFRRMQASWRDLTRWIDVVQKRAGRFREGLSTSFHELEAQLRATAYLSACNKVGRRGRVYEKPEIQNLGSIQIGDRFLLDSRTVRSRIATGSKGTITIGDDVSVEAGTTIAAQNSIQIGSRVRVGRSVTIDDSADIAGETAAGSVKPGPVLIEDDVKLEDLVTIGKGVCIGQGTIVRKASVVSGSLPARVIAAGSPARVVKQFT